MVERSVKLRFARNACCQFDDDDERIMSCTGVRLSGAGTFPPLSQAIKAAAMSCPKFEIPHWTEVSGG